MDGLVVLVVLLHRERWDVERPPPDLHLCSDAVLHQDQGVVLGCTGVLGQYQGVALECAGVLGQYQGVVLGSTGVLGQYLVLAVLLRRLGLVEPGEPAVVPLVQPPGLRVVTGPEQREVRGVSIGRS